VDEMFHGYGACHYANGSMHQGNYARGKRNGRGKLIKANGDIFEGVFLGDHMIRWVQ